MDKNFYKFQYGILIASKSELEKEVLELKDKVKELETELYFCRRNNKIEKEIDG